MIIIELFSIWRLAIGISRRWSVIISGHCVNFFGDAGQRICWDLIICAVVICRPCHPWSKKKGMRPLLASVAPNISSCIRPCFFVDVFCQVFFCWRGFRGFKVLGNCILFRFQSTRLLLLAFNVFWLTCSMFIYVVLRLALLFNVLWQKNISYFSIPTDCFDISRVIFVVIFVFIA